MKTETYCSACLKRCGVAYRDDSFDHGFGTERVFTEAPDCHPDDEIISREEAVKERWSRRRRPNAHVNPIMRDILNSFLRAA